MPVYTYQLPDGRTVDLEAQSEPSPDEVDRAASQVGPATAPEASWAAAQTPEPTPSPRQRNYDYALARKQQLQASGEYDRLSPMAKEWVEPVAPDESTLHRLGRFTKAIPSAVGAGVGFFAKGAGALVGKVAGTGDTLEDVGKAATWGSPLPVEVAANKIPGVGGVAARAGLGFAETVPKLALLSAFPGSILAQSITAGGIFGMDDQGNFSPKSAVIGALLPGAGYLATKAVSKALSSGVAGAMKPVVENTHAQFLMEEMGRQAALNAVMLAGDSPELIALYKKDPEAAMKQVGEIMGQNLAWSLFGAGSHYLLGHPTATTALIDRENRRWSGDMNRMMEKLSRGQSIAKEIDAAKKKQAENQPEPPTTEEPPPAPTPEPTPTQTPPPAPVARQHPVNAPVPIEPGPLGVIPPYQPPPGSWAAAAQPTVTPSTEGVPNAVQVRSSTPLPVGETPGGRGEVGARVPEPEEPAVPQAQAGQGPPPQGPQPGQPEVGKRIEESAGQPIYPTLEEHNAALKAAGFPAETDSQWRAFNESQIKKYVEAPAQPIVRKILDEGNRPISSNAYGPGDKGVWFEKPNGESGFYPLEPIAKPEVAPTPIVEPKPPVGSEAEERLLSSVPTYVADRYRQFLAAIQSADQWFAANPEPDKGPRSSTMADPMTQQASDAAKKRWETHDAWVAQAQRIQKRVADAEQEFLDLNDMRGETSARQALEKLARRANKTNQVFPFITGK